MLGQVVRYGYCNTVSNQGRCWAFYGRFWLFVKVCEQGISAFSQYICFSGSGPLSMRQGQLELSSKRQDREHTVVPTIFRDSCRSRITIEDIVTA